MAKNGKFLESLASGVAGGKTIAAVANEVGCSTSHGYTLSSSPEFRQRVSEIRSEMTTQAVGRLCESATLAVDALREMLGKEFEPAVRLNAAKSILGLLGPLSETHELRQRLTDLEKSTTSTILKVAR